MLSISNGFRRLLNENKRNYICSAVITLEDNTVLNLTNSEIWFDGFDIDDAVSEDESFTALGSAIIGSATLVINNIDESYSEYDFTNAKVVMYIGLNVPNGTSVDFENLKKGTYRVDDTHYNGATITLNLLDYMEQFDRPYITSLIYPVQLYYIIQDACTKCGVQFATTSFPHQTYQVNTKPDGESVTFREVIEWASAIAGCFARCNVDGALELKWFDREHLESWDEGTNGGIFDSTTSSSYQTGDAVDGGSFNPWTLGGEAEGGAFTDPQYMHNLYSLYSQDICIDDVVITGIRILVEADDEEAGTVIQEYKVEETIPGASGYLIELSGNEFITTDTAQDVADWLADQLIGLRFRKLNITQASDPSIEAGDIAVVWDRKGRAYPTLVTRTSFSVNSPQTIVCGAETPSRNNANRFSSQTKNYVETRRALLQERNAWEQAQEEIIETLANAQGVYYTEEATQSGSILWLHNRINLNDSSKVIVISDAGIYVTNNYQDPNPTWSGLSMSGSILAKFLKVIGINAEWIRVGTLIVQKTVDGQTITVMSINMANGEVYMNPTYLLVGDGNNDNLQYILTELNTEVGEAAKTASQFLYYTQTSGLIVSEYGTSNGRDPDDTGATPLRNYYNVQIKGSGINFRLLSQVLMYMGINSNDETVITMFRTAGGLKAMQLQGDGLSFYGASDSDVVSYIGTDGLDVRKGSIGDFTVTNTGAASQSVENDGHIYAKSLYCNYTGDATYNYEYGIHGNQSDKSNNNIVFYVARVPKNEAWTSQNRKFLTYLYTDGKFVTTKAEIGGWTIGDTYIRSSNNGIQLISYNSQGKAEIVLGGYSRGSSYSRRTAHIDNDGNISGNRVMIDYLLVGDGLVSSGQAVWNAFEVTQTNIRAYVPIKLSYAVGQDSGTVMVIASDGTLVKQAPSSKRYKDIDRLLTDKDIENAYNIHVYRAKYKDGYLRKGSLREGQYIPMLIAENVEENIPEAVLYNSDGQVEDWDYRVMIPVHQQMLIDQNKRIKELESEVAELKSLVQQLLEKGGK